ncbi:hypothetical protein BURCENBC7_AP1611 [Burkholderia cenocepacia BC7]|nr:hypothetical protein BURCENK562V_C4776 [Burkholderia cenocepacia K56-2Valvano]ERI30877.1 hypothetical protein BURCENBC7_AP1611 [Burkholderia cenocepacia BC7]
MGRTAKNEKYSYFQLTVRVFNHAEITTGNNQTNGRKTIVGQGVAFYP